jgi:purine-nucleoside phosphorylase
VEVAAMQGRFHLYEGWDPADVALPIRALAALGAGTMLLTNAAGGIRPGFEAGRPDADRRPHQPDVAQPADRRDVVPGEQRFPDMSDPYDAGFRAAAERRRGRSASRSRRASTRRCSGPSYETPAEIRMLARLGADAVGMSTVPEVLVARALGVRCLGISCITNLAAGLGGEKLTHEEVMEVGARVRDRLAALVRGILPRIAPSNLPSEAAA